MRPLTRAALSYTTWNAALLAGALAHGGRRALATALISSAMVAAGVAGAYVCRPGLLPTLYATYLPWIDWTAPAALPAMAALELAVHWAPLLLSAGAWRASGTGPPLRPADALAPLLLLTGWAAAVWRRLPTIYPAPLPFEALLIGALLGGALAVCTVR